MGQRILIADDSEEIREVVNVLLSNEGYEVLEACDGHGAVEHACDVDLFILDVMMPELDGYKTCRMIREKSNAPILFLTAKTLDGDKVLGFSSGGDDYLVKPFSYNELISRVKALLRRYCVYKGKDGEHNEATIDKNNLTIHLDSEQVFVDGERVALTEIEYQILILLIQEPKKVFSNQELYESIWNSAYLYTANNTIMVHMRNLRKKLGVDPQNPMYIKTVWVRGIVLNRKIELRISRLSLKFIGVVILATIVALAVFSTMFFNRYRVFGIFNSKQKVEERTKDDINLLQERITKQHISKSDSKKILKEMKKFKGYSMYMYDRDSENDAEYFVSNLEHKSYFETSSFFIRLYDPNVQEFTIDFYDGSYPFYVYPYHGATFMIRYLFISAAVSSISFICIIMGFVHRKMRYVLEIGEEMKSIETGDFHSTIVYKGNDEITLLARQLNELRNALYTNMVNEEDARKANEDLVTAMSHDLRTPLTSLMGYLDILHMKIYKSEEDHDKYILKSKQKAEQIKEMSDRLFNHFLVYAQQDQVSCVVMDQDAIRQYLDMLCQELMDRHYKIYDVYDKQAFQVMADKKYLERIYGNIFSNILKYADKEMVIVSLSIHQGQAIIKVKNKKKKDKTKEESTHIGLKSIEKMMKDMGGYVELVEDEECFSILLYFPCREIKE